MKLAMPWSKLRHAVPAPEGGAFALMLWRDAGGDDAADPDATHLYPELATAEAAARAHVPAEYAYGHVFEWDPAEGDYAIEHGAFGDDELAS